MPNPPPAPLRPTQPHLVPPRLPGFRPAWFGLVLAVEFSSIRVPECRSEPQTLDPELEPELKPETLNLKPKTRKPVCPTPLQPHSAPPCPTPASDLPGLG